MKKLFLLLLLTCFWMTAKTQNPTATIQTVSGVPGSTVAVNINVSNFTWGVAAMQYSIHYDSSVIRYVSTTNWFPGFAGAGVYAQSDSASLSVVIGVMDAVYINNILCTMNFQIKKAGCSDIIWHDSPTPREWTDGNYFYYDGTPGNHPAIDYTNGQVCGIVTGIEDNSVENASVVIYPSVAKEKVNVKYSIPENGKITLGVYNLMGDEVQKISNMFVANNEYNQEINVSDLSSGLYFIKYQIETANINTVKTEKITVAR